MSNIETIYRAIQFMEENLNRPLYVTDVAAHIGYSVFHFSRLFQGVTTHTPGEYILKRRLSRALEEIRETDGKIIDIALYYGFNSPETFSRTFKKQFGFPPSHLRQKGFHQYLPTFKPLTRDDLQQVVKIKDIHPEIIELGTICLTGMMIPVYTDHSAITRLWVDFKAETRRVKNAVVPERFYQFTYELPGSGDPLFEFNCLAAMETRSLEHVDLIFVGKTIPAARYLRFLHKGHANQVGLTYKYIYNSYLPQTDYTLSLPYQFEKYDQRYCGPDHEESVSEIFIPIQ